MAWIPSPETIERQLQHAKRVERNRLRDEFALAAMRELMARPGLGTSTPEMFAHWSYEQADAMLAARERKEASNG